MTGYSVESEAVLRSAGWWPDRQVDTGGWVEPLERNGARLHEAAQIFLGEFGGLVIDISGSGVNRAREPFEINPLRCLGEEERFQEWGDELGRTIFPIGILDKGRYFLGIDEQGEIYLVEAWVGSFGRMPQAMENLISGVQPEIVSEG